VNAVETERADRERYSVTRTAQARTIRALSSLPWPRIRLVIGWYEASPNEEERHGKELEELVDRLLRAGEPGLDRRGASGRA
jgi:hypothetical protein